MLALPGCFFWARFAARFGPLHVHPIYPLLPDLPEILVLDTHADFLPDNDNWHTDVTFTETPPLAGILDPCPTR